METWCTPGTALLVVREKLEPSNTDARVARLTASDDLMMTVTMVLLLVVVMFVTLPSVMVTSLVCNPGIWATMASLIRGTLSTTEKLEGANMPRVVATTSF